MRETAILERFSIFVFILAVFILFVNSCGELSEQDSKQVEHALSDSLFKTTESWDVDMEILEEGRLKLKLTGSYAATIKNDNINITKISGPVYIEIYNEQGDPDTIVDADSAVHRPNEAEFELFGNVNVKAPEGKNLSSQYLKWERKQDRVSTPEFLTIITPTDSINAIGFVGDTDLKNYTLKKVTGETVIN